MAGMPVTYTRGSVGYAARALAAVARHPAEGVERVAERLAERGSPPPGRRLAKASPDLMRGLHEMLALPWPCGEHSAFVEVWQQTRTALQKSGLEVGRGAFGGWDDADPALAHATWCIVRHRRPETLVETGVGRGLTTRIALEALRRNRCGHLWSIDVPPMLDTHLSTQTAAAVSADLRGRWTYVSGSSRQRLRGLLRSLGRVDFFLHDSMHTDRNVRFELEHVWSALGPRACILVDDVERSPAFPEFAGIHPDARTLVAESEDGAALIGVMQRSPALREHTDAQPR